MLNNHSGRGRALLVVLFVFSLTLGVVSNSITFAQIEPEEPILIGDDPGTGGGGGGGCTWRCPVKSITQEGAGGSGSCTSVGCKKSSSHPDSYWVCAFRASGQGVTCPPLEQCDCD